MRWNLYHFFKKSKQNCAKLHEWKDYTIPYQTHHMHVRNDESFMYLWQNVWCDGLLEVPVHMDYR